jgi:hypothetical protein
MQWIAQENQPDGTVVYHGRDDSCQANVYARSADACHLQLREAVEKARVEQVARAAAVVSLKEPTPRVFVRLARRLRVWADWLDEEEPD